MATTSSTNDLSLDQFLGWRELRQLLPVSRTTIWAWRRRGDFPAPLRLSPGRMAWRASDVRAWMEARECAR